MTTLVCFPVDYRLVVVGELACPSDLESYTVGGIPPACPTLAAGQRVEARLHVNGSHWSSRLGVGCIKCMSSGYQVYDSCGAKLKGSPQPDYR